MSFDKKRKHKFALISDDLQLANVFKNHFSQTCSELRQQIPINVREPLSFFGDVDQNHSAFRFYDSIPDEVGLLNCKIPVKDSRFYMTPT